MKPPLDFRDPTRTMECGAPWTLRPSSPKALCATRGSRDIYIPTRNLSKIREREPLLLSNILQEKKEEERIIDVKKREKERERATLKYMMLDLSSIDQTRAERDL